MDTGSESMQEEAELSFTNQLLSKVDSAACRREGKNILQMPPVLRKWDSKLQWKVIKGNVKLSPLQVDSAACRRGKTILLMRREVDSAACRREVKLSFTSQLSERGG